MASDTYSLNARSVEVLDVEFNGRRHAVKRYIHSDVLDIYVVQPFFPDKELWETPRSRQKTGIVVHHDAGGAPATFTGELQQLQVIYEMHVANGWNGIGYHYLIAPSGRVWHTGHLGTHRAHTKGLDPYAEPSGKLNETKIGICFMGNYADGKGLNGSTVDPLGDRPSDAAVAAFKDLVQLCADIFNAPMDVRPHKYWAARTGEPTLCPGDWAPLDAWDGTVITPSRPAPAPEPEPAPAPAPEPEVPEAESVFVGIRRDTLRELGAQLLTLANHGDK